jgi:ribonucleoside-diphosphate reductase beta chain
MPPWQCYRKEVSFMQDFVFPNIGLRPAAPAGVHSRSSAGVEFGASPGAGIGLLADAPATDISLKKIVFPVSSSLDPISIGAKRPSSDQVRIIGGRGYDLRQPIPVKYTAVRDKMLAARQNFWTPQEIPMGKDKEQWNTGKLSEAEAWMFKCNISYLTASDNLVPDNLDNAIIGAITANEMRQYLRWIMAEESNHLESYLFILESFGLDEKGQGQIFNLYQEVPELGKKLNWNLQFTNNVVDVLKQGAEPGSREHSLALLEDLISYFVFEFLFFPLGFSQVFALARQGKLANTAQQYQYIWRDENLHSANGLWLIRQIIAENPALWDAAMQERARAIVDEAVRLEADFARATMPDGGILGMSFAAYSDYARFMGNNICRHLGVKTLFDIKEHPMPWLSEYEIKQEVNFFEARVRDYRVGGSLEWD